MIIIAILLYIFLSVLDAGIIGCLLAFILSRPGKLVSTKVLALDVLVFFILYNLVMYTIITPLDLTLTTGSPILIDILGSPDLSDIFQPSFGVFDIGFYAIDVVVGTSLGKFLVRKYYKRYNFPTTESNATSG